MISDTACVPWGQWIYWSTHIITHSESDMWHVTWTKSDTFHLLSIHIFGSPANVHQKMLAKNLPANWVGPSRICQDMLDLPPIISWSRNSFIWQRSRTQGIKGWCASIRPKLQWKTLVMKNKPQQTFNGKKLLCCPVSGKLWTNQMIAELSTTCCCWQHCKACDALGLGSLCKLQGRAVSTINNQSRAPPHTTLKAPCLG